MDRRIYLDMDGVLVDFIGGALKIHGWTRESYLRAMTLGEWDLVKPMGMTEDEFWGPIHNAGERFWVDLRPLPWINEIIDLAKSLGDLWIMTSPTGHPTSYSGKIQWLQNWFGREFNRIILTSEKHFLAQENTLLIDDREETVQNFAKAGGDAVVFPTLHNSLYCYADDPMKYLSNLFER